MGGGPWVPIGSQSASEFITISLHAFFLSWSSKKKSEVYGYCAVGFPWTVEMFLVGFCLMLTVFIQRSYLLLLWWNYGDTLNKDKPLMVLVLRPAVTSASVSVKGKERKKKTLGRGSPELRRILGQLTTQSPQLSLVYTARPYLCFK